MYPKYTTKLIASLSGNIVEWYDFALMSYLSPVLAQNIFVTSDHMAALLQTLMIYAMGFLVRPLGAVYFGHLGDRWGRSTTLKLSMSLMSVATFGMALMPSYSEIGCFSPMLFALLRILQGLALGGEFAGSMIYLSETANPKHRALISSMTNNGSNFGIMLATMISASLVHILTPQSFTLYGWRIAFALGGTLGLVGLKYRHALTETAIFDQMTQEKKICLFPLRDVLTSHKEELYNIVKLLFMSAAGSYLLMGYLSTYLHTFLNMPFEQALKIQSYFILGTFIFVPVFGMASDKYGRRIILIGSAIAYILLAIPCFYLLGIQGSWLWLVPLMIVYSAEQATTPVTMIENFPAHLRYTGLSLAYNFTMAVIGGFAPYLCTNLSAKLNDPLVTAYFLTFAAMVTGITCFRKLSYTFGEELSLV